MADDTCVALQSEINDIFDKNLEKPVLKQIKETIEPLVNNKRIHFRRQLQRRMASDGHRSRAHGGRPQEAYDGRIERRDSSRSSRDKHSWIQRQRTHESPG